MEELIKEINAIPGVDCTCFFASNGEVVHCSLESPAKEQMINASKMILKLLLSGSSQIEEVASLSICFEESILNARKLKTNNFLIIRHSQTTDANLINLTIETSYGFTANNKNKADNESVISKPETVSNIIPNVSDELQSRESQKNKEIIQSGPLANILAGIMRAFTKLEGSQAQSAYKNALVKWSTYHEPKLSNLKYLVDILSKELNDQAKIDKFRKMILPYLAHARDN